MWLHGEPFTVSVLQPNGRSTNSASYFQPDPPYLLLTPNPLLLFANERGGASPRQFVHEHEVNFAFMILLLWTTTWILCSLALVVAASPAVMSRIRWRHRLEVCVLAYCLATTISEYSLGEGTGYCNHLAAVSFAKGLGMFQNRLRPSSEDVTIAILDLETNGRLMGYL